MVEQAVAGASSSVQSTTELEIRLLLDAVYQLSGYDFREYPAAPMSRRIVERVRAEKASSVAGLLELVLHAPQTLERLIVRLTQLPVTPRPDGSFFAGIAAHVIPRLRTYPFFRIWVAGCANGRDVYPLAILLHEAKLIHRARIYATEATDWALAEVKEGALTAPSIRDAEEWYREAGGSHSFSDYVEHGADGSRFVERLRDNVVFAKHHIAAEGSFNEFQVVIARWSIASLGRALAYRAHQTLYESVCQFGFLCTGADNGLHLTPHRGAYEHLDGAEGVFRRVR